jgi:hypothetical protein
VANFYIAQGNTLPVLVFRMRGPDKQPIDLSVPGTVVTLLLVHEKSGCQVGANGTISFLDAVGGVAQYAWATNDTRESGILRGAATVTQNGQVMDCPNADFIEVYIRPRPGRTHG